MELDLTLRVRVHSLQQWIKDSGLEGVVETSPGVRSCMVEYDMRKLSTAALLDALVGAETVAMHGGSGWGALLHEGM